MDETWEQRAKNKRTNTYTNTNSSTIEQHSVHCTGLSSMCYVPWCLPTSQRQCQALSIPIHFPQLEAARTSTAGRPPDRRDKNCRQRLNSEVRPVPWEKKKKLKDARLSQAGPRVSLPSRYAVDTRNCRSVRSGPGLIALLIM